MKTHFTLIALLLTIGLSSPKVLKWEDLILKNEKHPAGGF